MKKLKTYEKLFLKRSPYKIEKRSGKYIWIKGERFLNFSSNDYLGIASSRKANRIVSDAFLNFDISSSSSRLVCGNYSIIEKAEEEYAKFFGYEDALFFPSGYQANLAVISALFEKDDVILFDKHAHSSIIKGIMLSEAEYHGFNHNSISHLRKRLSKLQEKEIVVITESLFSMDGDLLDTREMKSLKQKYGFFCLVDEAHAFGVLGEKGKGIATELADIAVGTLGKAFGFSGAFVLLPNKKIKELLFNLSLPIMHSTAISPAHAAACKELLYIVAEADEERKKIRDISYIARDRLKKEGFSVLGDAHIISLKVGDEKKSLAISKKLLEKNIYIPSIRYPTVPIGKSILRISITSMHTEEDIDLLINALKDAWSKT